MNAIMLSLLTIFKPKPHAKVLLIAILAMGVVILASNILVAIPLNYNLLGLDLSFWLTWGAFTYPLAFLVTDLTNRLYGANTARFVVLPGFLFGLVLSLSFADMRIALASATAFMVAQLSDITIFNALRLKSWWRAPLISSMLSSILDTGLFFSIAFMGTDVPWLGLALGDLIVKLVMAFLLLPCFRFIILALKPAQVQFS